MALLVCASVFVVQGAQSITDEKQLAAPPARKKSAPKPAYSISLRPLGYREPLFERVVAGRYPVSLNFFTADRLLFTFNTRGLLARDVEHCDGPYDDDQLVQAELLSLPDGKLLAEARWQFHDHNQYLWPVHGGVLVRRCHEFDLLQNSLEGHRVLDFPERPMLLQTSPDGRTIVVETQHEKHTPEEHKQLMQQALLGTGMIPAEDIDLNIIALDPPTLLGKVQEHTPVRVPLVRNGSYNTVPAQHNHWVIIFQPFFGQPVEVTKVESNCAPVVFPLSEDAILVATCVSALNYHVLIAYNRDGKELWRDDWLNNLTRPVFALSADNQCFAVGTVHTASSINGFGSFDEGAAHAEDITVYSTYKGHPLLSLSVSPPYATGQNFALSPDGSQLAVLNHNAIDVYDVPHKK
jgi:hypothetical protein